MISHMTLHESYTKKLLEWTNYFFFLSKYYRQINNTEGKQEL